jgi:hypothetical protein
MEGRDYLEELDLDGRITLRLFLKEILCECVDWIHVAENMVQWWAVNT